MPLHLDYRPGDFDKVIGNEATIKSIKSIFDRENKDYPHAWLFQGPTGCGKTTIARIVSKYLGCDPDIGNQDFQEINSSNNRGIDTAREIQKSMKFLPMSKKNSCRVYLLDEVHNSTKDYQHAILKALEDTPKHVYLLLCTTDPQKLLKTIRNRCSTFEVKNLTDNQVSELINSVLDEENVDDIGKEIIDAIVKVSEGCPRQALVTLDQIIDLDPDEMMDSVNDFRSAEKQTIDLCRALLSGTWKEVATVLKDLSAEPEKVRHAVLGYMQAVILKQTKAESDMFKQSLLVMECFGEPNFYNGKPGLTKACADVFS